MVAWFYILEHRSGQCYTHIDLYVVVKHEEYSTKSNPTQYQLAGRSEAIVKFIKNPVLDFWLAIVVFAVLLGIYSTTLLPGVGFHGDTPKFQFVGSVLGIPHPTGFPTYLLLNHTFCRLFPWGSLAWKANLLSALLNAVCCSVLFRLLRTMDFNRYIALATTFSFGLIRSVWLESLGAEVYTLHLLFMVLVIYTLMRWRQTGREKFLRLALLTYALSFGNHLLTVMLLPALVYFVVRVDYRVLTHRRIYAWSAMCIMLGAVQYGYLFWRSADPTTLYVEQSISSFSQLWNFVSGAQYRQAMFGFTPEEFWSQRMPGFAKLIWLELSILLPLVIIGMVQFRDRIFRNFLLIYLLVGTVWALNYNIQETHVNFLPSYLVMAIFAGAGFVALTKWLHLDRRRYFSALILVFPIFFAGLNYSRVDQSDNKLAIETTENLLQYANRRAVIISPSYNLSEYLWYYLIGEQWGKRDIFVMHHFDAHAIREYLEQKKTFYLPEQRRDVPLGLTVYCFFAPQLEALAKQGLALECVQENLYQVTAGKASWPKGVL